MPDSDSGPVTRRELREEIGSSETRLDKRSEKIDSALDQHSKQPSDLSKRVHDLEANRPPQPPQQ